MNGGIRNVLYPCPLRLLDQRLLEQIAILFEWWTAFEELDTLIFVILIFKKRKRDFSNYRWIEWVLWWEINNRDKDEATNIKMITYFWFIELYFLRNSFSQINLFGTIICSFSLSFIITFRFKSFPHQGLNLSEIIFKE